MKSSNFWYFAQNLKYITISSPNNSNLDQMTNSRVKNRMQQLWEWPKMSKTLNIFTVLSRKRHQKQPQSIFLVPCPFQRRSVVIRTFVFKCGMKFWRFLKSHSYRFFEIKFMWLLLTQSNLAHYASIIGDENYVVNI